VQPGLVSTIIPVFNRAPMMREAVASVLAQTHRPIEIIVVDDGSTDDTPQAIGTLANAHPEIRSVRIANGGPGVAREAGRLIADGEFIQYLDSDDLLTPRKFEMQIAALRVHPEAAVAYGKTRYRDPDGNEIACTWKNANQRQETILPSFLIDRWWETATPLYRRSVCDAAGPWLPLRLEEDWEYDCRIGALGVRLAYADNVVAEHRDHPHGRLSRGAALDPARLRQRAEAHARVAEHARRAGLPPASPEMQHYARELFHLARQCGASGLGGESRRLIDLARSIAPRWDLRLYALAATAMGWTRAGKLSMLRERLR
jgi:GT2 family glycosyltransferase